MNHRIPLRLLFALLIPLGACDGSIDDLPIDEIPEPVTPANLSEPIRDPVGPADLPQGRALRRMSAAQFNASLTVATGQTWGDYETYAAALGRADFAQVTEEGVEFNVTFEKLVEDAARVTCRGAVTADEAEGAEERIILRHLTSMERDPIMYRANLEYMLLRFLGSADFVDGDERLTPWMTLLQAPTYDAEGTEAELTDELMAERWTAVCAGLVTHPDFVSY
ncbi:MAG: hypothetical protein ACI9KE_001975 [Polyangiales bacterium]|jgi:hypothetical protein